MSNSTNSNQVNKSKSIYDITHKIEEELTYIYEMRMKQYINPLKDKETVSDKSSIKEIAEQGQTISLFAR